MFRAQVLIVRRPKLYITVSGIITALGDRPVHRLRVFSQSVHRMATYIEMHGQQNIKKKKWIIKCLITRKVIGFFHGTAALV